MRSAFENMLRRRKPYASQQIDLSHPLTRNPFLLSTGLVGCWLFNDGGGNTVRDIVSRNDGAITSATWGYGPFGGPSLDFSSAKVIISNPGLATVHTVSFWMVYNNAADAVVIGGPDNGGSDAFYSPYIDGPSSGGNIYYRPGINAGSLAAVGHGGFDQNRWYHICIVRYGTNVWFYKDGLNIGGLQTLTANGNQIYTSFGSFSGGTLPLSGSIDNVLLFNRDLGPSEVMQLYTDPFCFMRPLPLWPLNVTAAAASAMLKRMQTEGLFVGRGI